MTDVLGKKFGKDFTFSDPYERSAVVEDFRRKSMRELSEQVKKVPDGSRDIVRDRLIMMTKVIQQSGGRVLPKGAGSAWPAIARTLEEIRELEAEMPLEDRRPMTLPFTARQVSQAEEAMFWPIYVKQAQQAAALGIWMRCHALRIRGWQNEAVRRGFARSTAKRRQEEALDMIAYGLIQDGKPLEACAR